MLFRPPDHPIFSKTPDPNVTVVPYPTPRGERVQPKLGDIPAFPGAEEIDGFTIRFAGTDAAVQHFAVEATPEEILNFYWDALFPIGYQHVAGSYSQTGQQWHYGREEDRVWIVTEYMLRGDDLQPPGEQPYGFRGQDVQSLEGADGKTWFFVVTIDGD